MESDFKVGDAVVCVDASPCKEHPYPGAPFGLKQGGIFRIKDMYIGDDASVGLYLSGVDNEGEDAGETWEGYDAIRFKHLPKADDTFINQMRSLKPAKEKTRVR